MVGNSLEIRPSVKQPAAPGGETSGPARLALLRDTVEQSPLGPSKAITRLTDPFLSLRLELLCLTQGLTPRKLVENREDDRVGQTQSIVEQEYSQLMADLVAADAARGQGTSRRIIRTALELALSNEALSQGELAIAALKAHGFAISLSTIIAGSDGKALNIIEDSAVTSTAVAMGLPDHSVCIFRNGSLIHNDSTSHMPRNMEQCETRLTDWAAMMNSRPGSNGGWMLLKGTHLEQTEYQVLALVSTREARNRPSKDLEIHTQKLLLPKFLAWRIGLLRNECSAAPSAKLIGAVREAVRGGSFAQINEAASLPTQAHSVFLPTLLLWQGTGSFGIPNEPGALNGLNGKIKLS